MGQSETKVLLKVRGRFRLTNREGESLAEYGDWKTVAEMLSKAGFSTEEIANVKSEIYRTGESLIDR